MCAPEGKTDVPREPGHFRFWPNSDLTGFLTHLRGRRQKFASANVSRFTSTPYVWSHRQVGALQRGRPRRECDILGIGI
jgi:hypothetical protein